MNEEIPKNILELKKHQDNNGKILILGKHENKWFELKGWDIIKHYKEYGSLSRCIYRKGGINV